MSENPNFIKEHIDIIVKILSNVPLKADILERRINYIISGYNSHIDEKGLSDIKEEIKRKIESSGRTKFSEVEMENIIYKALGSKREYDKSYLCNLDKHEVKSIKLQRNNNPTTQIFGNVKITRLGSISHTEWNGVEDIDGLGYYTIEKQNKEGKTTKYRVFSHINILKMNEDELYRNAVLEELLDELNMTKTNCGGYIGNIEETREKEESDNFIKVNEKYSLSFESIDATIVQMARNMISNENKSNENQEIDGR